MPILTDAPFNGANGSTPPGWTVPTSGTFQIENNQGVLTPSAPSYVPVTAVYNGVQPVADGEVYVEYTVDPNADEAYTSVVMRGSSGNSGYNPDGIVLAMSTASNSYQVNVNPVGGSQTNLAYVYLQLEASHTYGILLRTVGDAVQSLVWDLATTKPDNYDFSGLQTDVQGAGYVALQQINGATIVGAIFDNLTLYDGNRGVAATQAASFAELFQVGGLIPASTSTAMPTGTITSNGHTWKPVNSEDFLTTAPLGAVRSTYTDMGYFDGFPDTSKQGTWDSDSVLSVANSLLTAKLHSAVPSAYAQSQGSGSTAQPLVACVMPDNYSPTTYGRFSIRFRAVETTPGNGTGYKFVWMFWPEDNTWNEGEIDAFETDIRAGDAGRPRPANAIPGSGIDANGNSSTTSGLAADRMVFTPLASYYEPTDTSDFHIATCEWAPEGIRIYWDGVLTCTIDNSQEVAIPTTPMTVHLQMETVISEGTVDPAAVATVDIDWVVTYTMTA